ncbi:MAG: outer membrane beta-barrel protein [Verrucomicrobiales bacterium]
MKTSAFLMLVTTGLAVNSLQAGETTVISSKNPPPPIVVPSMCDCFDECKAQVSLYGAGIIWDSGGNSDALGAGLSVGYFFTENIGIEVDGTWLDTNSNVWHASGSLVFRWPIRPACIAPYIYAGGGVITDSETDGTFHVGGGIDIRLGKSHWCPGLFADARYTWTNYEEGGDFALIRAGFRFNL